MLRILAICLSVIALLSGSSQSVYAATSSPVTRPKAGPTPTDAQIDATIRMKLAKSKIGKDGFKFKVARGIVTWEGKTDVIQHKGSATRMARSAGAVQVVNNIQISDAAKAKAAGNLTKGVSGAGSGSQPKRAAVS